MNSEFKYQELFQKSSRLTPSAETWEKIQQELKNPVHLPSSKKKRTLLALAASLLIGLGSTLLWYSTLSPSPTPSQEMTQTEENDATLESVSWLLDLGTGSSEPEFY